MSTKVCTKCSIEKELEEFSVKVDTKDGYSYSCKECASVYYLSNKERIKANVRVNYYKRKDKLTEDQISYKYYIKNLKWRYNLTEDMYRGLVESQQNSCSICKTFFDGLTKSTTPNVDHNHTTGEVRSLLCGNCNRAIGLLKDDYKICMRAATYLMSH